MGRGSGRRQIEGLGPQLDRVQSQGRKISPLLEFWPKDRYTM